MTLRLSAFLGSNSNQGLLHLSQRAKLLAVLQQHYQQVVPPPLMQASRVMQLHGPTLILAADNGAVASKLRQISPEIIAIFQKRGIEVTGIQIRVQVRTRATPVISSPRKLDKNGKNELESLALTLQEGPLKNALRRLARR